MDTKKNRSNQPSSKGLSTTDSKKTQDVPSGKLWPRGGRRREPNNGNYPIKSENTRKPIPQHGRALDKRPRARGTYTPNGVFGGGKENAWVEEPELGSVFIPGSKKQSLNHLLNFHYAPRDKQSVTHSPGTNNHGHKWLTTGKHRYNKEHFIQANCQFIVNSLGDYRQYMNNPDALVDWNLIEQINLQVNENPSCPICLYPPAAGKMTRCGHIYCWACILHYLALSDNPWSKCPICYESIHKKDLKSVVSVSHASFNVNEPITFKLMKRMRGSLIAYPADQRIRDDDSLFHMNHKVSVHLQCKLLLADNDDVMGIISRERSELTCQLTDQEASERCFIEEALRTLQEREDEIIANLGDTVRDNCSTRSRNESCNSDATYDEACSLSSSPPEHSSTTTTTTTGKCFYFYQAADGQHIYLHAINARMLEHTYGSLEFSPKTLTGRIVEKEGGSMTEELRNRLRYLQHLPVTCQFEVAEIQFQSSVVSKETADFFAEQMEIRKKRRLKRARDEKRREKKIAEEENRQMGLQPIAADIGLESQLQFPNFGVQHPVQRQSADSSSSSSNGGCSVDNDFAGPSFAKMLTTAAKHDTWPGLKANSEPPPQMIDLGQKVRNNISAKASTSNNGDSEPEECEDYVPVPEFNRSFGDAIALALEKACKMHEEPNNGDATGKKQKKKKNKQKKLLFATSMVFNGN